MSNDVLERALRQPLALTKWAQVGKDHRGSDCGSFPPWAALGGAREAHRVSPPGNAERLLARERPSDLLKVTRENGRPRSLPQPVLFFSMVLPPSDLRWGVVGSWPH